MTIPSEIRLNRAARTLDVAFGERRFVFTAEFLRVESPSAEVQGHAPDERRTVPGKRDIGIVTIEPVGNYAIRILFDDRHDTGIFSWEFLETLGLEQDARWENYLSRLAAEGLSRDPIQK